MKIFKNIFEMISYTIGTLAGIGLIKFAPGTLASLVTATVWFFIPDYYFYNSVDKIIHYDLFLLMFVILIPLTIIFVYISKICEKEFGKDAPQIVIDEVIGYLFAVLFLPKTLMVAIYAFVLFRIFDITKPLYINKLQKLPHGWGVMLDDVAAGITANILLIILYFLKPSFFILI